MRKYLIVEDFYCNAFLSTSRDTKKHLRDSGKHECTAYDRNGYIVSMARRDPETGKPCSVFFENDAADRDMENLFADLDM